MATPLPLPVSKRKGIKVIINKKFLIKKYWKDKLSIDKIAQELNYSKTTIRNRLIKYNVRIRTISEAREEKYNFITKKYLIKEYIKNKKSTLQIASEIDCNFWIIRNKLIKYNIARRNYKESSCWQGKKNPEHSKRISGKNHPNWKGGIINKIYYCKEKGCSNKISYGNWKCGQGRCGSCSHKGRLNFHFGKLASHGKRLKYNNIFMRSTWESLFAQFLSLSGIKWLYEFKTFNLGNFTYTPDFYLPEFNCYVEIKGYWRDIAKKKFRLFKKQYSNIAIKLLMRKDLTKLGIIL